MQTARYMIEVQAGLISQQAEQQFTKRWAVTGEQWQAAKAFEDEVVNKQLEEFDWTRLPAVVLTEPLAAASNYLIFLATTNRVNWVRLDWIQV